MTFRTTLTNPQNIRVFEKKLITLHFGKLNELDATTEYRLNLQKLPLNEFKNHEMGLTGVQEDFRINIELGSVADLLESGTKIKRGQVKLQGYNPRFFLFFHTKKSKKYSAISETFKAKKDDTNYEVLLPTELLTGEAIWDIELNHDIGPMLKLNPEVIDVRNLMRNSITWQSLILPMAIKQVLLFYIKVWSGSFEQKWQKRWAEFIDIYAGSDHLERIPDENNSSEHERERWASEIVEAFCEEKSYKHLINEVMNSGEAEDE